MPIHCPGGCSNTVFAREKDLHQHLRISKNPKCQLAAEALTLSLRRPVLHDRPLGIPRTPSPSGSGSGPSAPHQGLPIPSASPNDDLPVIHRHFEGDYFGADYQDEDFPFLPGDEDLAPQVPLRAGALPPRVSEVDEDDPSDDEEDIVGRDLADPEASPSRPHPPLPRAPTPPGGMEPRVDAEEHEHIPQNIGADNPENHAPEPHAREELREAPVHIHHFGGQAGAPIVDPAARTSTYNEYGSTVADGDADNPYAPFASRMEWELAKWAKERGVSATAFTDLLKIHGVRPFTRLFTRPTTYPN